MPWKNWRSNREKRKVFARRALRWTALPAVDIAKASGLHKSSVQRINISAGARNPDVSRKIGRQAGAKKQASKRQKTNLFTLAQKEMLLKIHEPGIIKTARIYFAASEHLRNRFSIEDLIGDAKIFVSGELDYYMPGKKGRTGRAASVFTWIIDRTKYFCLKAQYREMNNRERQMPDSFHETLHTNAARLRHGGRASDFALARIPAGARKFLRRLGVNLNSVANQGYPEFRDLLTKIIDSEGMGLSQIERLVGKARLEGKTQAQIVSEAGKAGLNLASKATVIAAERKVAVKIRSSLGRV